jgi:hypothetical protein
VFVTSFWLYQPYYTVSTNIPQIINNIKRNCHVRVTLITRRTFLYLLSPSGSINHNIQFQLSVPESVAFIQNVKLVNKDGNKLSQLEYDPGTDTLPAIDIPKHKLPNEPFYLQLTANTNDGKYPWYDIVQNSGQ